VDVAQLDAGDVSARLLHDEVDPTVAS
jgi:hypothetical protein